MAVISPEQLKIYIDKRPPSLTPAEVVEGLMMRGHTIGGIEGGAPPASVAEVKPSVQEKPPLAARAVKTLFSATEPLSRFIALPEITEHTVGKLYEGANKSAAIEDKAKKLGDPDVIEMLLAKGIPREAIEARKKALIEENEGLRRGSEEAYGKFQKLQGRLGQELAYSGAKSVGEIGLASGLLPLSVPGIGSAHIAGRTITGATLGKTAGRGLYGFFQGVLTQMQKGEKKAGKVLGAGATDAAVQVAFGALFDKIAGAVSKGGRRVYTAGTGAPKRAVTGDIKQGGLAALEADEAGPRVERLIEKGVTGGRSSLARQAKGLFEGGGKSLEAGLSEAQKAGKSVDLSKTVDDVLRPLEVEAATTRNPTLLSAIQGIRSRFPHKINVTSAQAEAIKESLQDEARTVYDRLVTHTPAEARTKDIAARLASSLRKELIGMSPKIKEGLADKSSASFLAEGAAEQARRTSNKLPILLPYLGGALAGGATEGYRKRNLFDALQGAAIGAAVGGAARSPAVLTRLGVGMVRGGSSLASGVADRLRTFTIQKLLDALRK